MDIRWDIRREGRAWTAVELVFVGGRVADLLVTDPVGLRVRPTSCWT